MFKDLTLLKPLLPPALSRVSLPPGHPSPIIALPIYHNPPKHCITECVVRCEWMHSWSTYIENMPAIHGQISEGSLSSIDLLSLRYILQLKSAGLEGVSCVQAITLYNPFYELIKFSLVVNMSYTQMVLKLFLINYFSAVYTCCTSTRI